MKRKGSVALGGILCALSLAAMMLTVFPLALYALPALAGILLLPMTLENGPRWGLAVYVVTALLSLLIPSDMEAKVLFIAFFGYYPLVKLLLERIRTRWLCVVCKLLVFSGAMIGSYALLLLVFHMDTASFEIGGVNVMWGLLVVGNGVFLLFDRALDGLIALYRRRVHPAVSRLLYR